MRWNLSSTSSWSPVLLRMREIIARNMLSWLNLLMKLLLLRLFGYLYYYISDARSHVHQICRSILSENFICGSRAQVSLGLLLHPAATPPSSLPQSVGLLWTRDRPIAETSTWQHTTLFELWYEFSARQMWPDWVKAVKCLLGNWKTLRTAVYWDRAICINSRIFCVAACNCGKVPPIR